MEIDLYFLTCFLNFIIGYVVCDLLCDPFGKRILLMSRTLLTLSLFRNLAICMFKAVWVALYFRNNKKRAEKQLFFCTFLLSAISKFAQLFWSDRIIKVRLLLLIGQQYLYFPMERLSQYGQSVHKLLFVYRLVCADQAF